MLARRAHKEVRLFAGNSVQQTPQEYRIRVLTSDKLGAGTDAKVHIVLEDDTGKRCALTLEVVLQRLILTAFEEAR